MDKTSYFIKDIGLFGSFPTNETVKELENIGVRIFVDLTFHTEKNILPYHTNYKYLNFPIKDRFYPENKKEFSKFILEVTNLIYKLKLNEKIYIHCKGGHGRSGVVVAILLCQIFNFSPEESLEHTKKSHNNRIVMREKWRFIGCPQTFQQKNFVINFCKPIHFCDKNICDNTLGFSNFSNHNITIKNVGTFINAESAFQSYKTDDLYIIKKLFVATTPRIIKKISSNIFCKEKSEKKSFDILFKILKYKFEQHNLINKLIDTNLSPIIYNCNDIFFLDNNLLGKCLTKLRNYFISNNY